MLMAEVILVDAVLIVGDEDLLLEDDLPRLTDISS